MPRKDGCNKFENLLSLDFLRGVVPKREVESRHTWHFHRRTKARSCTTPFHLARTNQVNLAKDVKVSTRWEAPQQFLSLLLYFAMF